MKSSFNIFTKTTLRNSQGFTLTEMLIVIALIGVVGTFVTVQVVGKFNRAKVDSTKIQIRQLSTILKNYRLDCGQYPTTEQGLDALIEKPTGGPDCRSYDPEGYVSDGKYPQDAFGNDFLYNSDGKTYEVISLGNDGKEGGEDIDADISSKNLDGKGKQSDEES